MSDSFCRKSISLNLLATSEIVPLRPSSACLVSKGVQREMCNLYCLKKKRPTYMPGYTLYQTYVELRCWSRVPPSVGCC